MSQLWQRMRDLLDAGEVRVSEHGYDELAEDGLSVREVLAGVSRGLVIEAYPEYPKGPSVLVLQEDHAQRPIHVVWGIPRGHDKPVVLVTAYRPDPGRWEPDFMRRR